MIIYGSVVSPYVRKVLMFAGEKGVVVEQRPGGMGQGGDEFAQASPFGKMPALRDPGAGVDGGDYLLADSSAICAYLDAKHPDNPLIPAEARARGECIWFDEFADTILTGAGGKMFFNRVVMPLFLKTDGDLAAADVAETKELPKVLDWLNARLSGRAFLVGDSLTLADIAVIVPFNNVSEAGYVVDAVTYPDLTRWIAAIGARPSIAPHNAKMSGFIAKVRGG